MNSYALPKGTVLRNKSLIGRESAYTVEKVLGQGGFGITYLASQLIVIGHVSHKVYYAVKEFFVNKQCWRDKGSCDMIYSPAARNDVEECRKDFLEEARRLNRICSNNPNIVNVNEVFEANNTAYYVMEYLTGGSLREKVLGNGPMSERDALPYIIPVARAVEYIHQEHKLLHCDISPDNIMLRTDESGMPTPVLIDFGESLHFNSRGDLTTTHTAVGAKEGYAPQEQYQGVREFDPRIDVYALSATLFYLLTGHRPLSAFDLSRDNLEKNLPDGLSPAVRDAIIHGMAKDKKLRTATVEELVSELTTGQHPVATPDELRVGYMLTNGRTAYRVVSVVEKTSAYIHYKAVIGDCGSRGEAGKTKKLASQCNIYEFFAKGVHHRAEEGTLSADGDTSAALQGYLSLCGSKTGNVISRQFQTHSGPGWATFEANNTYYLVWTKVKKPLPWKRIATYSAGAVGSALLVWGIITIVRNNIEANERERQEMSQRLTNAIADNDSVALKEFAVVLDSARAHLPYAKMCLDKGDFATAEKYANDSLKEIIQQKKDSVERSFYGQHEAIKSATGETLYYWTGELINGIPNGKGILEYTEQDEDRRKVYRGNVSNGLRNDSSAVLSYTNGNSYKGSFVNDKLNKGKLMLESDGMYFEGSFMDNQPYNGKWYFTNGSLYSTVTNGVEK